MRAGTGCLIISLTMILPPSQSPRAAVITALPLECDAVLPHLSDIRQELHPAGTIYRVGRFHGDAHDWEVATVVAGMHNVQAALEAERVITHFKPEVLLFCGVAGALKDVKIGDVVAATKVYWYEAGKDERKFKTRVEVSESSYALVQRAMVVASEKRWQGRLNPAAASVPGAVVKPMAAGAKVVADHRADSYRLLRQHFSDAVAVDMESYGFLRAVYSNSGVSALAVRGISDAVEGKEQADAEGGQPRAAAHAAAFAFQVLAEFRSTLAIPPSPTGSGGWGSMPESMEQIAAALYPRGPIEGELWSRAGGDIGCLTLTGSGRTDWHAAFRVLRNGGGGGTITLTSLLETMRSDFPNNKALSVTGLFAC